MSDFVERLLQGVQPSEKEWESHLIEAHGSAPSMSPEAFASCLNGDGINSYEWVSKSIEGLSSPNLVVDLACGDGHLVPYMEKYLPSACHILGVDISAAGLEKARSVTYSHPVEFRRAHANELGLKRDSVDAILCHMAIMLMPSIEPVIQEILRVLKPGRTFAAVVTNRSERTDAFKTILEIVEDTLHRKFPNMPPPKIGDARTSSREGIIELFGGNAKLISMEDDSFGREVDPNGAWDHVKNMYLIGGLPEDLRAQIRQQVVKTLASRKGPIRFEFAFRKFELRKNS